MAQTIQDFTRIYDSYLAAVKGGVFSEVAALFSQELRDEIQAPEDQEEYMLMARYMAPASYEPLFLTLTDGGRKAELQVVVTIEVPEELQREHQLPPTQRAELILRFVQEDGQWKWGSPLMLGDPDTRARPQDLEMGSRDDYGEVSNMQIGGQILRVEEQAAGSVFLIRVLDEEIAVFVPAELVSAEFTPGSVLVLYGAEHKSDKLKFWADAASLDQR